MERRQARWLEQHEKKEKEETKKEKEDNEICELAEAEDAQTAIHAAVFQGDLVTQDTLSDQYEHLIDQDRVLMVAVRAGSVGGVTLTRHWGASDRQIGQAFLLAVRLGRLEVMSLLAKWGACTGAAFRVGFWQAAAESRDPAVMRHLYKLGCKDKDWNWALTSAALANDLEAINIASAFGADNHKHLLTRLLLTHVQISPEAEEMLLQCRILATSFKKRSCSLGNYAYVLSSM